MRPILPDANFTLMTKLWMAGTAEDQVLRHLTPPRGVVIDRAEIVNVVGFGHEEFTDLAGVAGALRLDEVIPPAQTLRDE